MWPAIGSGFYGYSGKAIVLMQEDSTISLLADLSTDPAVKGDWLMGMVQVADGSFYAVSSYNNAEEGCGTLLHVGVDGTATPLHQFSYIDANFHNSDGCKPNGLVIGKDGAIYGTTQQGGPGGGGVLYKWSDAGLSVVATINESGTSTDSAEPVALVQGNDGAFYAPTIRDGAHGYGGVIRIGVDGSVTPVYDYSGSGVIQYFVKDGAGNFYGVATDATVFKLTSGGQYTAIPTAATLGKGYGTIPWLVVGRDGHIYGAAGLWYGPFYGGEIFQFTSAGKIQPLSFLGTLIAPFYSEMGIEAIGQGSDGSLYGVASHGDVYDGTSHDVWKLTLPPPAGWTTARTPTVSFSITPTTISRSAGQTATASWSATNAQTCELASMPRGFSSGLVGQLVASSGSMAVPPLPPGTYSYILSCVDGGRWKERTVILDVKR
jgi:uncharacterized repeat protein (TIGR03803 family)